MKAELVVLQSQQMKDGGMKIPEVHLSLHRAGSGVVGLAMGNPCLYATTGQPEGKAVRVVSGFILLVALVKRASTFL